MIKQDEHIDEKGRRYAAYRDGEQVIIKGPPEGLVDILKLPEPFATRLHNALLVRGCLSYRDVRKNPNTLVGALQEALGIDVQKLMEAYMNYEKEPASEGG